MSGRERDLTVIYMVSTTHFIYFFRTFKIVKHDLMFVVGDRQKESHSAISINTERVSKVVLRLRDES